MMFCSPSGLQVWACPVGGSGYGQYFVKLFPENSQTALDYSSPGAGWSRGKFLFFFWFKYGNLVSISWLDRENQGLGTRLVHWSNAG